MVKKMSAAQHKLNALNHKSIPSGAFTPRGAMAKMLHDNGIVFSLSDEDELRLFYHAEGEDRDGRLIATVRPRSCKKIAIYGRRYQVAWLPKSASGTFDIFAVQQFA